MYNLPKFRGNPCAALVHSDSDIAAILEESKRLSGRGDFVLMLKPSKGVEKRLLPSYIGAMIRQSEGAMRSSSLAIEVLLFVSGTMNIGNAIRRAGASGSEFVIFSSSKSLLRRMISKFRLKVLKPYPLFMDPETVGKVAIVAI